ncbi:glycosyltransferase [Flavobacterium croceum]|uniref:glycosyltransferase n=1 Tax=Flavobacterium croceum TaxID=370975 RepID=UPI0024A9FE9F|nr:glycosyltransferase [Flavobacterium croceum]
MIVIVFFLIVVYVVFIIQIIYGFTKVKTFQFTKNEPKTKFSIIIPFRNEEKHLTKLLNSIARVNYPIDLFEIIAVDDFSDDQSVNKYNVWRLQNQEISTTLLENMHLSGSPKKDALTRAIPIAKNDWIITIDADCKVGKKWLLAFDNFIQQNQNIEMVAAPVVYKEKNNWFHHFQQLELLSLQATTIGAFGIQKPFMCNGANFAYTKRFFNEIGGFGGVLHKASGDDVLLLQKAANKNLLKVAFLKNEEAKVCTQPQKKIHKLFMQRVRWASKSSGYSSLYAKTLALVVFFANVAMIAGLILLMLHKISVSFFMLIFLLKYVPDFILIQQGTFLTPQKKWNFPFASAFIYPFFATAVGLYSLFGTFTWKGRVFKS